MRNNIWTLFVFCAIVSALVSAKHGKRSKPSATVSPADEFGTEDTLTTTKTLTTTTAHTTTTKTPTTTTAHTTTTKTPTTTTAHTTTTETPTTTTAHTTTTETPTTTTAHTTTTKTPTTTTAHTTTTETPTTTTGHTTTTETPTTTTGHTTTTTGHTTTTTETPKTTTAHTTTTKTPTTTTAPTTTTPVTTTLTTTSGPTPPLTAGNYSLKNDKGETCLMAHMALQIKLTTLKANGTFTVQPQQAIVAGTCQTSPAILTLSFPEGFITFIFSQNKAENLVYVNTLSFQLSYTFSSVAVVNGDYKGTNNSLQLFGAKIGHCYSCKSDSIYLGNGLSLEVTQEKMQAFNVTGNTYGHTDVCRADQPDYRVAIAVGVILGVLIIIVLVAYLLGRRRKAQGYQSL